MKFTQENKKTHTSLLPGDNGHDVINIFLFNDVIYHPPPPPANNYNVDFHDLPDRWLSTAPAGATAPPRISEGIYGPFLLALAMFKPCAVIISITPQTWNPRESSNGVDVGTSRHEKKMSLMRE